MPSALTDAVQETVSDEEERRLRALARTALLDTATEELFDRYVRIAAVLADAPVSLISLVDRDRQWFKAGKGVDMRETPRSWAFCDHAIRERGVFEVEDARADPRFADNPLVLGEAAVRFYAGAPLRVDQGQAIGTLCVIGSEPKRLTKRQRSALADLAMVLTREIETNHLAEIRADRAAAARAATIEIEHQMRNMFAKVGAIIEMTAREAADTASMAEGARRRVVALSQANEVALRNDFGDAPLDEVAAAALQPVRDRTGVPIQASGDAVSLTPAAASVLAPLIDELAHDADRRGAVEAAGGVRLGWRAGAGELVLSWWEAAPPGRDAYASDYLTRVVPTALRGATRLTDDGYELRVPLAAIEPQGEEAG